MNLGSYPFYNVHDQIKEEAKKHGFEVLDLIIYYRKYSREELTISPGKINHDGHPNPLGYKIAADALYNIINLTMVL